MNSARTDEQPSRIGVIVASADTTDTLMLSNRLKMMGYAVENLVAQDGLSLKAPRDCSGWPFKSEEYDLYGGKHEVRKQRKKERREHLKTVQLEAATTRKRKS